MQKSNCGEVTCLVTYLVWGTPKSKARPLSSSYVDGINWYTYCQNNPTVHTDPYGLSDSPTAAEAFNFPPVLPPGWAPDWEWVETPGGKRPGYWRDPDGGTWSPHPEDPVHNPHWDNVDPKTRKNRRVPIDPDLPPLKPKPMTVLETIGAVAASAAKTAAEEVSSAARTAGEWASEHPVKATVYVVGGAIVVVWTGGLALAAL
jgi:hypothetical protein